MPKCVTARLSMRCRRAQLPPVLFLHCEGTGTTSMTAAKKHCPNCRVTLTQFRWSKLWWMSSVLSGRLVQPCAECGTQLRLSSMALVTTLAAVGVVVTTAALIVTRQSMWLIVALACAVLVLVGVLGKRVEPASDPIPD